jgi:hypothetical protein
MCARCSSPSKAQTQGKTHGLASRSAHWAEKRRSESKREKNNDQQLRQQTKRAYSSATVRRTGHKTNIVKVARLLLEQNNLQWKRTVSTSLPSRISVVAGTGAGFDAAAFFLLAMFYYQNQRNCVIIEKESEKSNSDHRNRRDPSSAWLSQSARAPDTHHGQTGTNI